MCIRDSSLIPLAYFGTVDQEMREDYLSYITKILAIDTGEDFRHVRSAIIELWKIIR